MARENNHHYQERENNHHYQEKVLAELAELAQGL